MIRVQGNPQAAGRAGGALPPKPSNLGGAARVTPPALSGCCPTCGRAWERGDLLEEALHALKGQEGPIRLTPQEWLTMKVLWRRRGALVHIDQLNAAVGYSDDSVLRHVIMRLRRKLAGLPWCITSTYGGFYRLEGVA